ncbi:MAG: hypothetical protein KAX15_02725 [Candidatus Omnitrophica bacterium]|nr:hypothetical protein [Candidatus Omnitrophota bacterium]
MKLDCRSCTASQKTERGCEQDSPIPGVWEVEGWQFQRCPLKLVTTQSCRYIEAYNFYEKGYLPCPGEWPEQSAKFLEAIRVINNQVNKGLEEKQRRWERRGNRKG